MKHAYLIIAHDQFKLLKKLLELLDSENSDIYIHIDKKAQEKDISNCLVNVKKSKVKQIQSYSVNWGGYSLVKCTLELLKESTRTHHDYYHLISGHDLPIKTHSEFDRFLELNYGKEFIHYAKEDEIVRCNVIDRIQYFHWFQENLKCKNCPKKVISTILKNITLSIQRIFRIKREIEHSLQFGSQWFSITENCAKYIVQQEEEIEKVFKYTRCSDEMFIQMIVFESPYYKNVYDINREMKFEGCLRQIDFERGNGKGNPYVYTLQDKEILEKSNCFFARKFDLNIDSQIVEYLYKKKELGV